MAIPKVCGIETEYGIQITGVAEPNPITASSVLINAYIADVNRRVGWDFEDEAPGRLDARGFARDDQMAPVVETHLVNAVLTNGARYYVDHAHPEYSTPECTNPLDALLWDRAGEEVLVRSMVAAKSLLPAGQAVVVYKNNSDHKGNSYGCHENYLMDRAVPFAKVVNGVMSHFVTRQIYAGAGKVGTETGGDRQIDYQISQRAEFFEEEVGLETTLKRPIVNTRDEPHADPKKYRRLHVILGDANLCEVATYLKLGTTAIILAMIEDDVAPGSELALANPVRSIRQVSYDVALTAPLELAAGGTITALEIQWELLERAKKYADGFGLDCLAGSGPEVLLRWESVLERLERGDPSLAAELDWVAKRSLLEAYRDRHGCSWSDSRMIALDLQYHDLRPERSLFARLSTEKLVTKEAVAEAVSEPPKDTRAYFRGRCLQRWSSSIVAANWDSIVFDLGGDPLRRVPMLEPLKGTAQVTDSLFNECRDPADLLTRLGS